MLAVVGLMRRARRYAQVSQSIDPLNPIGHLMVGVAHLWGAEFGDAVKHFERWHRADPTIPMLRLWYALALVYARRQEEALVVLREGDDQASQNVFTMIGLVLRYALTGRGQDALDAMNDALRAHARADQVYSWMLAGCYALMDRRQEAVEWLEHAARGGFINYPFLRDDLFFHGLHGHEAFERLMEEIEDRWQSFAA
jgi:tetratricopeptide (TPR) repeat protein